MMGELRPMCHRARGRSYPPEHGVRSPPQLAGRFQRKPV